MADETLAFSVKIDGVDRAINSFKDLKQAKKDATEAFLRGDKDAAKALADLKDKTEDLTDATQTLKGSGIEKINSSFSQLSEGFKNFDTEKIKIGFKGIGAAMSAIPILLIVEGIKYLVQNFDELSKGSGILAKGLQFLGTIITGLKDYFLKFGDILQGINPELRKMAKEIDDLKESMNGLLTEQTGRIERLTALAKANGESTVAYEKLKQDAIIATNKLYVDGIINYVRAGGVINEEQQKQLAVSLENIRNATNAKDVLEINHTKKIEEENHKRYLATQKRLGDELTAKNDAFAKELDAKIKSDEMIAAYEAEQKALATEKKAEEDAAFLEQARLQSEEVQAIAYSESDLKKQLREQELESFKENYQAQLNTAQSLTTSLSSLSDSYFYFKRKNLEKGSAEDLKQAKKQFDINKGLAIASATISGIQGVVNALSAQSIIPEPYGTVLKVVTAAAVGAAAVANIAKIASSKFDAGGGGGAGGGASAAAPMPIPAPPTINTPTANTNAGSTFDETGKRIGSESERTINPTINVKATVVETEMTETQKRVDTLEKQSTF